MTGAYAGEGGRGGLGLLVRPFDLVAVYGEASLDVTTVPDSLNDLGTAFSYSYFLGGGLRAYFSL